MNRRTQSLIKKLPIQTVMLIGCILQESGVQESVSLIILRLESYVKSSYGLLLTIGQKRIGI